MTVSGPVRVLSVTVCGPLVEPRAAEPRSRLTGARKTAGAVPLPVRSTTNPPASVAIVSLPVRAAAAGVKVT
jgi:hypothetical protein